MTRKRILSLFLFFSLFLFAPAASAQQPTPSDDQVNAIAKKLYCPVCENVPLDVCPTQACAQWRATIKEKLEAGWTEGQILDYFVQQYGERVLAQPSTRGLNVLVWVLPPVALAAIVAFYVFYLRRLTFRPAVDEAPSRPAGTGTEGPRPEGSRPEGAPTEEAEDEYVARLEQELEDRR